MSRARNLAGFGSAVTSVENPVNIRVGYVTAIAYYGDGSELTGTPGGLGTALSDNLSSPLNKIYYTNANLSIASTINVDPPESASAAYTQYTDIVMQGDADLIVGDGDDFIPDILGIGTFVDMPGILAGGDGKVRAANYTDKLGSGAAYGPYGFVTPVGVAVTVGSGTSISSPATNELALGTNDVERLRISSDGKVLVGTETNVDDYLFQVDSSAFRTAQFTRYTSDGATVVIGSSRGTQSSRTPLNINDYGGLIEFKAYDGSDFSSLGRISGQCEAAAAVGDTPGRLVFWTTADDASSPTERMRITSGGEVQIANGNLKFSTAGTGIDFSATSDGSGTSTSELLDDYEVGTFTATISFDAGTTGITYNASRNEGHYTKIGKQIFAYFRVQITSKGTDTGTLRLNTLPYVCADTFSSSSHDGGLYMARSAGVNASNVGASPVGGIVQGGNTYAIFQFRSSNGGSSTMDNTDIDNDFDITGMVQYFTN